ncbi:MAG: twin-arginine translocation pathway signal protein [Ketobacteraceae bacterium]|nr:twin-arginine translocation pathway signal protein [Ketobacteraceae bacterium]
MPESAQESAPEAARNTLPLKRRDFIRFSAASAGTITGATGLSGCATTPKRAVTDDRFQYLRQKDITILRALTPAVIPAEFQGTDTQNNTKLDRFMPQVDDFLVHSSNFTQVAMADLFDKLYFAPTRVLLTGMWTRWEDASPEQIDAFLIAWRDSSFNLLRGGYSQLTQLVAVIWYSQPENWPATHYPGPPDHITG